jgi:predicted phage terminase large subunit-like protein
MYRMRVEAAEHGPLIEEAWREHRPRWIGLEKINATMSLFHEAQRRGVVMRWLHPDGNKIARAETAVALSEQGRIYLPAEADWLDDYLEELTMFPSGEHDDMVDVTAYAAAEVVKRTVRGKHRKQEPTDPDEIIWQKVQKMTRRDRRHTVLGNWPS